MIHYSRKLLVTVIVFVVASALWVGGGLWLCSSGKARLTQFLERRFHCKAVIEKLDTNFLNTVVIQGLSTKEPFRIQADSVVISVQPWNLFIPGKHRHVLSARATHVTGDLTLPSEGTGKGSGVPARLFFPPIPANFDLLDSQIALHTGNGTHVFSRLQGQLTTGPLGVDASLWGDGGTLGRILLTFDASPFRRREWTFRASSDGLDLHEATQAIDPDSDWGAWQGKAQVELSVTAPRRGTVPISDLDWHVKSRAKEVRWTPRGGSPVLIDTEFEAGPKKLTVQSLKLNSAVQVSGHLQPPWKNPQLFLNVSAKDASLEDIAGAGPLGPVASRLRGKTTFVLRVSGEAKNPKIDGDFLVDASYGLLQVPHAEGQFSLDEHQLLLKGELADGAFELTGDTGERGIYHARLDNLSLLRFAQKNGWSNVRGRAGADFDIHATPTLGVEGSFSLNGLRWGRQVIEEATEGELTLSDGKFNLSTDDGRLLIDATRLEDSFELRTFRLNVGQSTFTAQGNADFGTKNIQFSVKGTSIPPDVWPPLVSQYPHMSGTMDLDGNVRGTLDSPAVVTDLRFRDLQFGDNQRAWDGSAVFNWSSSGFQLTQINTTSGYHGSAGWTRSGESGKWSAQLTLNDANPQFICDVMGSSVSVTGKLTGDLKLDYQDGLLSGLSSINWISGAYNDFYFDKVSGRAWFEPHRIHLDGFSLVKGGKAIRCQGDLVQDQGWSYDLALQLQRWGTEDLALDGAIRCKGTFSPAGNSLAAEVHGAALWLNDTPLDNFRMSVRKDQQRWAFSGQAESNLRFDLGYDTEKAALSGQVHGRSLSIENTFGRFFPSSDFDDVPKGLCDLDCSVSGPLTSPLVRVKVDLRQAQWRDQVLDSTLALEVHESTITVVSANTRLQSGGQLVTAGTIGLGEHGSLHLDGTASGVNLQSVFDLLRWPVVWDGRTDGKFSLYGQSGDLKMDISFQGTHTGFGPFRQGGDLAGDIKLRGGVWNLSGIRVNSGDGYAKLLDGSQIFVDRDRAGKMRLVADARNLEAGVLTFFGRVELAGSWKGRSTWTDETGVTIDLDLFARSLWINQLVLNGNVTHMTVQRGHLEFSPIIGSGQQLSGILDYSKFPTLRLTDFRYLENGIQKLYLDGYIGRDRWDFQMTTHGVDASIVRGIFDTTLPVSGPMDAQIIGKGTPEHPIITAEIQWRDAHIGVIPMDSGHCNVDFRKGIVRITDISVQRKRGYHLTGAAQFATGYSDQSETPPEVDLSVDKGDLAILEDIWSESSKAKGSFDGRLILGQKDGRKTLSGFLNVQHALVHSSTYVPELTRGELHLLFKGDKLEIQEAHARIGQGTLALSGDIQFADGWPVEYDLALNTPSKQGISARVPELAIPPGPVLGRFSLLQKKLSGISRGDPKLTLSLTGPATGPTLAGKIVLENTVFTYPPPAGFQRHSTDFGRAVRRFVDKVNWDITFLTGTRTWYESELVDARIDGSLTLNGPTSDLSVNGVVDTNNGSIVYSGNEFKINQATLEVMTKNTTWISDQTLVYLKANAEKDVYYTDSLGNGNQDTIVMEVNRALLGEVQPRFHSKNNPSLSSQRALQLALGLPISDSIESNSLLPDERANVVRNKDETDKLLRTSLVQLLDASLASPLARAIARQTGLVDFIRVSYSDKDVLSSGRGTGDDPTLQQSVNLTQNPWLRYMKGTQVQFGRSLTNRLFANYSFRVDQFQNQVDLRHEVELAYHLHRNLYLRAVSELDTEKTLGRPPDRRAILENRWRFELPHRKRIPPVVQRPLHHTEKPLSPKTPE